MPDFLSCDYLDKKIFLRFLIILTLIILILQNIIALTFATNYQPITVCPVVPASYNKTQILGLVQETKYQNPICAVAALNTYGQNVLNSYNIGLNLTVLTTNLSNIRPPSNTEAITISGGRLSHVPQSIVNLEIANNRYLVSQDSSKGLIASTNVIASTDKQHNWAGYVVYNSTSNITYAVGTWIVQNASASGFGDTKSVQWVGIGGYLDGNLVQVGTESDTNLGFGNYFVWYEYDPSNTPEQYPCNIILSPGCNDVSPGDKMMGIVYLVPGTSNEWNFTIFDFTRGYGFYNLTFLNSHQIPSRKTAEWIDERPLLYNLSNSTLTNFGIADYGPEYAYGTDNYTSFEPDNYAGANSLYNIGIGAWQNVVNLTINDTTGKYIALTGPLHNDSESFNVYKVANVTGISKAKLYPDNTILDSGQIEKYTISLNY